ncbi:MAG: NgoFVII family restriction endonuclease [Gammaproteobacteria bacterium]|nr:NgoFVII family restriction endonuclease [Gammaproteobacteria bacterium]
MFFKNQSQNQQQEYQHFLKIVGSLSNLYSDSKTPYLYYRIAEKLFCRAFEADDLSRGDVSADAKKDGIGIGLKTFLANNNKTFQKVSEFNSDRELYINLGDRQLIKKVSELRNTRIEFTERTHQITSSIYHCVLREEGKFRIFESDMDRVDVANIQNIKRGKKGNTILFNDGINDYSFSLSKSTLSKRFKTNSTIKEFDIEVLKDPLLTLEKCFAENEISLILATDTRIKQTIYLPLYGKNMKVPERSQLNQWNARGRKRNENEVYIFIPKKVHDNFPEFFPNRKQPFSLKLPNGKTMRSKVCQDNGKALMSYSNKELGQWILRDVLKLEEGKLLTYARLQILGIDSVRIDKIGEFEFEINFAKIDSYKYFQEIHL